MGSAFSCAKSAEDSSPPSPKENGIEPPTTPAKAEKDSERNGHAGGGALRNGDVGHALREAKDLLSEARKSTRLSDADQPEMAAQMASLVARLEVAVSKIEGLGSGGGSSAPSAPPPPPSSAPSQSSSCPFVLAFDELVSGPVRVFLDCSAQIGGDVAQISPTVESLFATQRAFLTAAAISTKPSDADFAKALEPTGKKIQEVISFRESHRTSPLFNHLSAISESISGLSWVAISPAPGPYVKEMGDAAMFYTNRVLKDFRDKDKTHVNWVQLWNNIFKELQAYIKLHHTTGVTWNPRGGSLLSNLQGGAPGGIPPPPPGGVPPPPPMVAFEPKAVVDDGRGKLFESINKGLDITSSLKKVSDDMKTHKNPNLREGPKPFVKASETPSKPLYGGPTGVNRPPRLVLEGKKWFVEYQKNETNIVIDTCKMEHCIYIFKCENSVIQVKGKANSVILDSCKKTSVVYDDLVSACEIVNCQSCQMQVMGKVATISIDKTDGCQVYLSPASLAVEIISAKSSEMNILIPKGDGDFTECPVPEQYKTTINGTKLQTVITEKAG